MANVAACRGAITKAMAASQRARNALGSTISGLDRSYQEAGNGWSDSRYRQLGAILEECKSAIRKPVDDLNQVDQFLGKVDNALANIERINL
jgi:hypothetical protein